ncbi:MAG: hypothetical protein EHM58_19545 [Ignavibacteriae bacterium]|nr:MAG: hypothetical protein EHM58_19545 [Ignavibacteriota bacterium]
MNRKRIPQFIPVVFILSLFYSQAYSQNTRDILFSFTPVEITQNRFPVITAGRGYTGIAGNPDDINFTGCLLNPAALNVRNKFSFEIDYSRRTKQHINNNSEDLFDRTYYEGKNPDILLGGAYKFSKKISAAAFFLRERSLNQYNGKYLIVNNAGEPIETRQNYFYLEQNTVGLSMSYKLNNYVTLGANLYYFLFQGKVDNYLNGFYSNNYLNSTADFGIANAQIGITYRPYKVLTFGMSFIPRIRHNVIWDESVLNAKEPMIIPAKLAFGTRFDWIKDLMCLYLDLNYLDYGKSTDIGNTLDFNLGIDVKPAKNLTLRAGYFSWSFKELEYSYTNYILHYFTLGASYVYKGVSINASFLDNKLDNNFHWDVVMYQLGLGLEL